VVSKKESPMSAKKKVLSWTQHLKPENYRDAGLQNIKYKNI
jgi:hypothetical protein